MLPTNGFSGSEPQGGHGSCPFVARFFAQETSTKKSQLATHSPIFTASRCASQCQSPVMPIVPGADLQMWQKKPGPEQLDAWNHMGHSLNSLRRGYIGDYIGEYYRGYYEGY